MKTLNKSRLRRSMLFVPGANAAMVSNAFIYRADALMFDLEDSVILREKTRRAGWCITRCSTRCTGGGNHRARQCARLRLRPGGLAGGGARRRGHRAPAEDRQRAGRCRHGARDCRYRSGLWPAGRQHRAAGGDRIGAGHHQRGGDRARFAAADRHRAGAEDYVRNLRTERSPEGIELLFARCSLLQAARAAGIQAFDTVYSDANNEAGFLQEAALIKQLGFDGKSLINPRQIELLHNLYAPTAKEVAHAQR